MEVVLISPNLPADGSFSGTSTPKIPGYLHIRRPEGFQRTFDAACKLDLKEGYWPGLEQAIDGEFFSRYSDFVQILSMVPPELFDLETTKLAEIIEIDNKRNFVYPPKVVNFLLNINSVSLKIEKEHTLPWFLQKYPFLSLDGADFAINEFNGYLNSTLSIGPEHNARLSRVVQTTAALEVIDPVNTRNRENRRIPHGISAAAIAELSRRRFRGMHSLFRRASNYIRRKKIDPLVPLEDGKSAIGVLGQAACAYSKQFVTGPEHYYFIKDEAVRGGFDFCPDCPLLNEQCARAARLYKERTSQELPNMNRYKNSFVSRMYIEFPD